MSAAAAAAVAVVNLHESEKYLELSGTSPHVIFTLPNIIEAHRQDVACQKEVWVLGVVGCMLGAGWQMAGGRCRVSGCAGLRRGTGAS